MNFSTFLWNTCPSLLPSLVLPGRGQHHMFALSGLGTWTEFTSKHYGTQKVQDYWGIQVYKYIIYVIWKPWLKFYTAKICHSVHYRLLHHNRILCLWFWCYLCERPSWKVPQYFSWNIFSDFFTQLLFEHFFKNKICVCVGKYENKLYKAEQKC